MPRYKIVHALPQKWLVYREEEKVVGWSVFEHVIKKWTLLSECRSEAAAVSTMKSYQMWDNDREAENAKIDAHVVTEKIYE